MGGWVGGSHLHNNATLWPNLQVRTCKNSSQVEFQVGPSVAKIESIAAEISAIKREQLSPGQMLHGQVSVR